MEQLTLYDKHPMTASSWQYSYLQILDIIAKKAADLCIGTGVIFDCADKKIQDFLDDWAEKQNLNIKLWKFAYQNSLIGRAHLWLSENKDGGIDLILGEMLSNTRVAIFNENEVAAQVFTLKNQGDKGHYFEFQFIDGKVIVKKWVDDSLAQVGTVETTVPKTAQLVATTTFDSGFDGIPLIETTNLPKPNFYPNNTMVFHPDWEPAINLIPDLQDIIKQKRKERKKNQTWFNGVMTPELLKAIMDAGGDLFDTLQDGLLENNAAGYSKGQQQGFNIVYGNPPLENYNQDWKHTFDAIMNASGYDGWYENENTSGHTTRVQTLMNGIRDEQTTKLKQEYYGHKISKLIDKVLVKAGKRTLEQILKERPFKMRFLSTGLSDMLQKDALINSRLANGTMSRIRAIQEYDNIPESIARDEKAMIDKELKEDSKNLEGVSFMENPEHDNESNESSEPAGDIQKDMPKEVK